MIMISIKNIRKRMTKGFLLMVFFLAQAVASSAQSNLYMEDFTISKWQSKDVALMLDNDQTASALEVHIQLPAGLSYNGYVNKTDRVKGRGAEVQASDNTGELIIVLTDGTIEPGEGAVVTFSLYNYGLAEGDHTITLSDIVVANPNADQINTVETSTVKVKALGLGDCAFGAPESFNIAVGQEYQVDVTLKNEGIYSLSAIEGKLALPAGLEIVPGEDGKFIYSNRTPSPLEFKFKEFDGYTSFVLSSSKNTTINGTIGVIFSFIVKASVELAENTEIKLYDLRIANTGGQSALLDNVTINVTNTSVADKAAFEAYQTEQLAAVEAMAVEGDSETSLQLIADAKTAIEAIAFDYALSLNANKAAIDAIVEQLTADLTAQRDKEAAEAAAIKAEEDAVAAANAAVAELKADAAELAVSPEAKAYEAENVQAAVAAAEEAIAAVAPAIEAVEALIAEGKLSTDNAEALAAAIAAAEAAIDAAEDAILVAQETYKNQKQLDDAAEAGAKAAAEASVTSLKVAMENVVIIEEAKNYPAENVKEAVTAAEDAVAAAEEAIAAIEALISEGKLATDNKVAVAQAINAAQGAVEAAKAAVKTANDTYLEQKAEDEATEAGALAAANAKLAELKAAAEALAVSAEAKAYEAENVKTAVADAETFILIANNAVAAVEAKIAEGNLATTNKEALAAAIAAAEEAIADAQGAIEQAETIYAYQKAADEAAALAAAKADLQAAIAAAKAANTEGMTEESIQALNDAIAAAEAALAAEDATVESLNAAKAAVEAAVAGLMVKPLFADGTYYLFNPASKLYMAAGSSWGTHAVVNAAGLDYIITYVNGKYTLDSQVSNGGTSHFLNGEWNDGQAMNWTFAEVAEGVFTLSNGEKFMTVQENGEVTLADDAAAEAAQWILKTKEDRLAEMAAATAEAPVDATFLVADGNFNRNDLRKAAWTGDDFSVGGDNTNMNAEKWGGNSQTFDIKQTIELPNGIYKVTWNGYYRYNNTGDNTNDVAAAAHAEGTEVINSFVYLNDKDYALTSIADENAVALYGKMPFSQGEASAAFGMGAYEQSAEITVEEGQLTIGIKKIEHLGTDWTVWDNFRLSYLGVPVVINPDDPEIAVPDGMINLIANGNLAGDDVTSFVSKEAPSQDIVGATIVPGAGKNNSRGIVVKSADNPAQAWDTQFWIKLNQPLTVNSTLHVEFDYAANKTAATETQAHGDPGNYKHWACIGSPTFTTEWQHFSADVTVSAEMADMLSIAFNLAKETTATEYYFDNFGVWAKIAEKPKEWQNIMVNSNMEGESMECFYVTEQNVGGPYVAIATEGIGKNGSKAVKVQSADNPTNAWDTQFFIRLPYQLPAGTQYKIQFDYKATEAAKASTQMHANPGQYIHWLGIGDVNFTDEWQSFELESTISADQSKEGQLMQTIAFNLAELTTANTYIFDNVKFYVPKDVVSTLTLNPDDNAQQYPVGILTLKNAIKSEGAYNLNGQKVEKTQKGLYIINGKKVVIK